MRVLESLFKIYSLETDIQEDVTHVRATLAPHRESEVYQGHFPGHPITPGVMMIEGVIEVLEKATSKKLRLRSAKNIKYLAMMSIKRPREDIRNSARSPTSSGVPARRAGIPSIIFR